LLGLETALALLYGIIKHLDDKKKLKLLLITLVIAKMKENCDKD
jgi:hypothetical protein